MDIENEHNCLDDEKLIDDIEKFGWSVILIEASDYLPSFAYTIGLWKNYNHPELICFGFTTKTLHAVLNIGGEIAKAGEKLVVNKIYEDFFETGSAQFLPVDNRNIPDYFGYAIWFNKRNDFPCLQLVWTDRSDRFPWDAGYEEEFEYRQPLLDRNADFKFREKENLAIFTTKQWVSQNKPVLRVIHEDDGDWQFLTGDQMPEDIKVVALKEMVRRDNTLNDVFNLDYGETAERGFVGDVWTRGEIDYEDE